jgi:hypothetical protein
MGPRAFALPHLIGPPAFALRHRPFAVCPLGFTNARSRKDEYRMELRPIPEMIDGFPNCCGAEAQVEQVTRARQPDEQKRGRSKNQ